MELTSRPRITVAVALAGAGVIIATPMAPPMPNAQVRAVRLTDSPAGIDPITAIEDVFKLAQTNTIALDDHFSPVPFPTLQQVIADLLSGKTPDLEAAGTAAITPFLPGASLPPGEVPPPYLYPSLDGFHLIGYGLLEKMFGTTNPELASLLSFAASPTSGVLLGDLSPILDPGLALQNSIQDALTAPDPQSAFFDLVNIPANIADATLNGAFLDGTKPEIDLFPLLSLLPAGTLPPGVDVTSLDLVLGGLLSPGSSLFNAIGTTITGAPVIAGNSVGPIGSSIELDQAIAAALGFSFPTPAAGMSDSVGDLLSGLTSSLDGDLTTLLDGSAPELGTLATDILTGLTSLF